MINNCINEKCKFYRHKDCTLLNCKASEIENCQYLTKPENDCENFIKEYNPKEYLKYLNYKNKNDFIKIGDKVVAITSGFHCGGEGGTVMEVEEESSNGNEFIAFHFRNTKNKSCISKTNWWQQVVRI